MNTNHANNNQTKMMNRLLEALNEDDVKRNRVKFSEFQEFIPLFNKTQSESMTMKQIDELSAKFFVRFNIYAPIEVIDENDKLIFRIPRLLREVNEVSKDKISAVNKFQSEGTSDIPKYASEAARKFVNAFLESQADVSSKGFKSFDEYIAHLRAEYKADIAAFNDLKSGNQPKNESKANVDEIDDLSWD